MQLVALGSVRPCPCRSARWTGELLLRQCRGARRVRLQHPDGRRRVTQQLPRWSDRAGNEVATAVRAPSAEATLGAVDAEGALVRADPREIAVGRQIDVAALAVRPVLQHGANLSVATCAPGMFDHVTSRVSDRSTSESIDAWLSAAPRRRPGPRSLLSCILRHSSATSRWVANQTSGKLAIYVSNSSSIAIRGCLPIQNGWITRRKQPPAA